MNTISKKQPLFRSFWQAGYECADHLNRHGDRVNILKETFHDVLVEEDYARLIPLNLFTVREGICWNAVEKSPGKYDWTEVTHRIKAGQQYGIQQIWDIFHFGYPDDLSPLHPRFTERFANVCRDFARLWRSLTDETLIVTPVNEISFISWLGGDIKQTVPYTHGLGLEVKKELVRAGIAGMEAIWEVDPQARFLHTEPLIYVFPGDNNPQTLAEVARINEDRFQALDMLAGRLYPELGGKPEYLDIIGLDFYYNNQWVHFGSRIQWEAPQDPRWMPLSQLLKQFYERYDRPLVVSETSHLGIGRGEWIREIGEECQQALEDGIDLLGVCMYPIIDRPDWDNLTHYHNSALWELEMKPGVPSMRILCEHYAKDLLIAQAQLSPYLPQVISTEEVEETIVPKLA